MTRKEAIKWLKIFRNHTGMKELSEAFEVAIKALEDDWIPVTYHQATDQEIEENGYPFDVCYVFDCPMPDDDQEILVTFSGRKGRRYVEKDVCYYLEEGYSLESGYDWMTDILAWKPLPESYKADKR